MSLRQKGKQRQQSKIRYLIVLSGGVAILLGVKPSVEAKAKVSKGEQPIHYSQASPESTDMTSTPGRIAIGFSTVQSAIPGISTALTGIYELNQSDSLQGFFSIPYTNPFNIGVAIFYKKTIATGRGCGFHVGGGLGLADINQPTSYPGPAFAMTLTALGGFHFELPGISRIKVHLDGGPSFLLVSTSPSASTNFQVGAFSPGLGASVLYVF